MKRVFLVQQTGDDIYLQADKHRIGQPYLRLQKRAVNSSDVAVSGHTGTLQVHRTKANFSCTSLCACNGNCYQDYIVKKNLTSKTLSGKSYNCLAFTARKKIPRKTSGINSSNSSFLTFSPFFDIGCPVVSHIKYIGTFRWAITGEEIRISSES